MTPAYLLLLLGALVTPTYADDWTALGCFSRSSVSASSAGTYIYQSSGYCQQECGGKRIAALINGNQCYCGDSDPSDSVDKKYCNKPCSGYGLDMCGGANYFTVYVNSDVDNEGDSDDDSSSTTKSTSSSTSTSSSSNKTSSTSSASSTTSSSQTHTTVVSTITDSEGGEPSVIYKTVVQTPSHSSTSETPTETETEAEETTAAADNNNKNNDKNKNQSKSISGGAIAGAVVGAVAGVGVIAALIFLFVRYRKKKEEDEFDDIFSV
ncbi:uncharacterized protein SPAPADRAFT_63278, partial [Spathaspora passalidarum NRRL Y-27907]